MKVSQNSKRELGIDALRIVSMLFVVCVHVLGQGGILTSSEAGSPKHYILSLCNTLVYCAVNLYGITTGYVLCQKGFKLSRLTKLWLTVVFWSVAVSCVFFVVLPETRTISEMISMFLPILRGRYWFFTAYFVTYMVSPVLNHIIRTLPREKFRLLLAALFVVFGIVPVGALGNDVLRISSGHHFSWMIVLYLIGGYIKVHGVSDGGTLANVKRTHWLVGYFAFGLANLLFKIAVELAEKLVFGAASHGDLFLTYSSPLIVGEAVCLFLYFRGGFQNTAPNGILAKLIRFATPGVFSVYIIHVHPLAWKYVITNGFTAWSAWPLPLILAAVLGTAAAVVLLCILLDAVRQRLFRILRIDRAAEKISDRAENTVRKIIRCNSLK